MERAYDLVIRGGTLADGSGGPAFVADVAVKDGLIVAVGQVSGAGIEEIDARGKLVTPGFVDIHTHYDGQATWDQRMQPSSWHGVTTVVMGNCGVGFAPCKPADHDRLVRLMEGVEDIPFPVLTEGLPWNWESFPDYLDSLEGRSFDVDIGAQLPHAALRVFVMGERGANREDATPDDIAAMAAIAKGAVEAGALGFSTSRTLNHRTSDGQPTPTLTASEAELTGIAMGLAAAGKGALQFVSDFGDPEAEFAMLRRIVEASGRPLSFSLVQSPIQPAQWRLLLDRLEEASGAGLPMRAQVCGRPVGVLFGLELTLNPFTHYPSYKAIAALPLAERAAKLADPAFRAQLLSEGNEASAAFAANMTQNWKVMFLMGETPDYEQTPDRTVLALAVAKGVRPEELALDHMLTNGGRGMLYLPFLNYANGSLDPSFEMLNHPDTVPGLSDGGAHVGMICDGSFPTSNLTLWTRDRTRGPKLPLETMVRMQSHDTAAALGLHDRGVVAPGYRADLNVIDYEGLTLGAPSVAYDLPAGGRRLVQRADGYVATIVAGQVTYRDGQPTGALPGRLLRGARAAPAAIAAE
ncbi:N-acyl-D-aspartate/D-glutamate deacylase [Phenylobacterium haematophilum]|uniref:N-acyl-D-aspartate/D-glutamate deacylase n=1 Tax=Phenylobacterium haematophilum TaxID=98513 RepID=A0A839ZZX2_9CAUL|nr:amidohydrolase family protein [Phenylobacterium haematophilum]MBB3890667.1 N-acyl-D-aspartate/D-glutamate deacylase [Phenylobacterium haematophilum]